MIIAREDTGLISYLEFEKKKIIITMLKWAPGRPSLIWDEENPDKPEASDVIILT